MTTPWDTFLEKLYPSKKTSTKKLIIPITTVQTIGMRCSECKQVFYTELEVERHILKHQEQVTTATLSDLNTEADPFKNANNPS